MVFGQSSDTETKKIVRGKSCSRQERCGKRQGWKLELPAEDKAQIWEIGKETFLLIWQQEKEKGEKRWQGGQGDW